MAGEQIWGIYIQPIQPSELHNAEKSLKMGYDLKIGRHKPGKKGIFISNHTINGTLKSIAAQTPVAGAFLGHIKFVVHPKDKLIEVGAYYPISRASPLSTGIKNQLRGKGLAALAEVKALRDLRKRFKGYSIRPARANNTKKRLEQVRKRGTVVGKAVPIATEIERIRKRTHSVRRR